MTSLEQKTGRQALRRALLLAVLLPGLLSIAASLWLLEPAFVMVVCFFLGMVTFILLGFMSTSPRHWRSHFVAGAVTAALIVSVLGTHWPLRLAYAQSKPAFDQAAEQVRAGNVPETPGWIGLFYIEKAEIYHNGVVCLWTNDHPSGPTGFVQHGPDNLPFNIWTEILLDDTWQFVSED
ncbi:MAG: hypothetical protein AAFY33_09200 [Cyanobacteria bacterium J06643_4]